MIGEVQTEKPAVRGERSKASGQAGTPQAAPQAAAAKPPRWRQAVSALTGVALLLLALWILRRWAAHVTFADLARELSEIGPRQVGLAIGLTALSFIALIGYEHYAVRLTRQRLPLPTVALYSFITQAISHATGFAIFVGATLRLRLYGGRGLSFGDVARIQLYFTTTFGLGVLTLGGLALLTGPRPLADTFGTHGLLWRLIGLLLLLAVAGIVFTGAVLHRHYRIFGHPIELPDTAVTLLLIALGVGDLLGVAATLHVLLPSELGLPFCETLAIFVAAISLGLVSHVPGSLGVFEAAVVLLVAPPPELAAALIGSLLAFRAIYYMLPLSLGVLAFGILELNRWFRATTRKGAALTCGRADA